MVKLDTTTARTIKSKGLAGLVERDPAVSRAMSLLVSRGVLTGSQSRKLSARVDPGLLEAAKQRFGVTNESDVITASLAMAAAPDLFKTWLRDNQDTVTEDFELPI